MRKFLSFVSLFLLGATLSACATSPTLEQIAEKQFLPLVDKSKPEKKPYQSILVGLMTPTQTLVIPFGTLSGQGDIATSTTIFEIGSISKGFLGLALAKESLNGALNLEGPYDKSTTFTWRQLAQHTAGLPRMPTNLKPEDPMQPYTDYDEAKLKSFLKDFRPLNPPGTVFDYSNLGAGIVGYRLEQMHRKGLEEILKSSFLDDLAMKDTRITLNSEQTQRMSPVFLNGEKSQPWVLRPTSVLKGAGSLRSSMQDMLILLKTMMGPGDETTSAMVRLATTPTFSSGKNSEIGLFWNRLTAENIIWHNGGTYGSSSFMGYIPDKKIGIVVLSNSQFIDENGVDPRLDIASIRSLLEMAATQKK